MKSSIIVLFLSFFIASCAAVSLLGQIGLIGTCEEGCSNNLIIRAVRQLDECPAGFECRSNGCGHTCQPKLGKRIPACLLLACGIYCPFGMKPSTNGCPSCACNPDPFLI
ncbi:unnamed protein product [Lymnaea stagnalis]|uniref:Antistasin-like domain-containing protein n=1 Tax=Lymnaea stagnalis TaxID=6523 RepID=A0AAV2HTK4_LYMST